MCSTVWDAGCSSVGVAQLIVVVFFFSFLFNRHYFFPFFPRLQLSRSSAFSSRRALKPCNGCCCCCCCMRQGPFASPPFIFYFFSLHFLPHSGMGVPPYGGAQPCKELQTEGCGRLSSQPTVGSLPQPPPHPLPGDGGWGLGGTPSSGGRRTANLVRPPPRTTLDALMDSWCRCERPAGSRVSVSVSPLIFVFVSAAFGCSQVEIGSGQG